MTNVIKTPVGTVNFYELDRPFGQKAEFEGTKSLTGNLGLRIEVPLDAEGVEEFKKATEAVSGKGVKLIESKLTGKPALQIKASTGYKPIISDADGNQIEAPAYFKGDVMKVYMTVNVVGGMHAETKTKWSKLQLNGVRILEHDTSKREKTSTQTDAIKEALGIVNEDSINELLG